MEKSLALALERGRYYPSVVQEAYDNVPNDKRSDPRMHGSCAKAEALSKEVEKANVTNMEELRKLAKNSVSTANRNDKKGKPMRACPSCSHVLKNLGIRDGNGG
jgi:protein-arginine kinase activator protein McsA